MFHEYLLRSTVPAFAFSVLLISGCSKPPAKPAPPPAPVRVSQVQQDDVALEVSLLGTVVPVRISDVATSTGGKVISYPYREGDAVGENDMLAQLRTVTLGIEIEAAKSLLRERENNFQMLDRGFRKEEIDQARAEMNEAKADHEYLTAKVKRLRELRGTRAISEDELESAESEQARALARYEKTKANYELKSTGYREEEIEQARAARDAQQQEVARLEDELGKRAIKSPFDGYLVEKATEVGEWLNEGGIIARVADLSEVEVVVNVDESYMNLVNLNEEVDVRFDALPGEKFTGVIKHVVPRSDWQGGSRSFPIKVRVENVTDERDMPTLKEGMLAEVTLREKKHPALLVHKDAIVRSSGRPVVYKVDADRAIQPVAVEELRTYGDQIEVKGGLTAGDTLVIEGNERLRPAQTVKVLGEPPAI